MGSINRGALGVIVADRERRRKLEEQEAKDRRAFMQRVLAAGLQSSLKSGQLALDPSALAGGGGPLVKAGATPPAVDPNMPLAPGETLTQRLPGGLTKTRHGVAEKPPAAQPFLTQPQTDQMLGEAQPGMPLPAIRRDPQTSTALPNIPVSPAGQNSLNRAIQMGLTESPAAQVLPPPQAPMAPPTTPPMAPPPPAAQDQQAWWQRLLPFLQSQSAQASPPPAAIPPPAMPMPPMPADPIAQRIQQALQQGIPAAKIAADLQAKGLDPRQYGL